MKVTLIMHFSNSVLWLTIIFLSGFGSLYLSQMTWSRYQSSPTVVSMDRDMFAWNTTFPCVTVCPNNYIDKKKLEIFLRFVQVCLIFRLVFAYITFFVLFISFLFVVTFYLTTAFAGCEFQPIIAAMFAQLISNSGRFSIEIKQIWPKISDKKDLVFIMPFLITLNFQELKRTKQDQTGEFCHKSFQCVVQELREHSGLPWHHSRQVHSASDELVSAL